MKENVASGEKHRKNLVEQQIEKKELASPHYIAARCVWSNSLQPSLQLFLQSGLAFPHWQITGGHKSRQDRVSHSLCTGVGTWLPKPRHRAVFVFQWWKNLGCSIAQSHSGATSTVTPCMVKVPDQHEKAVPVWLLVSSDLGYHKDFSFCKGKMLLLLQVGPSCIWGVAPLHLLLRQGCPSLCDK